MTKRRPVRAPQKGQPIPPWWFDHVLKVDVENNSITFFIDGRVIEARNVMFNRSEIERLWPEKLPDKPH